MVELIRVDELQRESVLIVETLHLADEHLAIDRHVLQHEVLHRAE